MKTENNQLNDKYESLKLKEKATDIPMQMAKQLKLTPEKAQILYKILYELLEEKIGVCSMD